MQFQPAFVERLIRWDRLPLLATDRTGIPREVYGWGTPDLDSGKLTLALRDLSFALLAPGFFDFLARPLALAAAPGLGDNAYGGRGLVIPLSVDSPLELHVGLYPVPKQQPSELQGLVIIFTAVAKIKESIEITPSLTVNFSGELDPASGLALAFWPDRPPKIPGNIGTAASALVEGASATLGVRYAPQDESERLPLLSFTGFQLDARDVSIKAGIGMGANAAAEAYVQAGVPGLRLELGRLGQDSFLAQLLPDSLALEFDLSVGWSIAQGLYWQNSTGPKISLPIGKRIGAVQIGSLDIAFASSGKDFR